MASIDQLLQRNKDFAATCAHEEASIIARHQVCVITCLDPRTDPSAFLELQPGDAMMVRNAGCPSAARRRPDCDRGRRRRLCPLTSDRIPPRSRM
jgi:carbonic anhydrase